MNMKGRFADGAIAVFRISRYAVPREQFAITVLRESDLTIVKHAWLERSELTPATLAREFHDVSARSREVLLQELRSDLPSTDTAL